MTGFLAVLVGLAFCIIAGRWLYLSRPAHRLALLDKTARRLDLAVDPANAESVARRLVRRERAGSIGYLVALALITPVELHYIQHSLNETKPPPYTPLSLVLPWVGVTLGTLVGRGVCAVLDARRAAEGPRVARTRVPVLSDYVRPCDVLAVRVLCLLVAPALCAAFVADPGPQSHHLHPWLIWAGVAVSLAVWILAELSARALLSLGQPATTLTDLAWDDAIRSLELRQLYAAALTPAIFVIEFAIIGLQPPDAAQPLFLYGSLVLAAAFAFLGKPASHFRRRLWPAPIDVIRPVTWRST